MTTGFPAGPKSGPESLDPGPLGVARTIEVQEAREGHRLESSVPRYSTREKTMARSDMLSQPDRGLGLDRPQTEAFHRRVQEADSRPPQRRKAQARGHGRVRPRQEHRGEAGQADKRDRLAARRRQPRARAEPDVSVNLFFTSFAKQARRSRKGGFTGCANVLSPIPITA